ncbi:hypothetical protein F443_15970 [Phytophthora nicotianae P1569]|uniref:Uncharacterized protein n=1 Tax=Phytophthora nicotianae P1569 TaxID=1317065 RepID=V9EGA2_PHYNI|nr:hypothetical protein F443_15970 [Phytophthora nicotianae P1569]
MIFVYVNHPPDGEPHVHVQIDVPHPKRMKPLLNSDRGADYGSTLISFQPPPRRACDDTGRARHFGCRPDAFCRDIGRFRGFCSGRPLIDTVSWLLWSRQVST